MHHPPTKPLVFHRPFLLNECYVDPQTRCLKHTGETPGEAVRLEPKVMRLLVLLASEPGRVFTHTEIEAAIWSTVIVADDTLARTVSKLRRALHDSAQAPIYIQTIPKTGYRLIAKVSAPDLETSSRSKFVTLKHGYKLAAVVLVCLTPIAMISLWQTRNTVAIDNTQVIKLTSRADDLYMQFTRADNEAAIALYERVIATDSEYAPAQAGLANALVQRVVRWPHKPGSANTGAATLTDALETGLTQTSNAKVILSRAAAMAERAVRLSPDDPSSLKALGFTYTAQGDLDKAESIYQQAINIDPNAWRALINLGEIYTIKGELQRALSAFEQAYLSMEHTYDQEPQRIGPWQAAVGVVIGENHETLGDIQMAELWYRRVLDYSPFEPEATTRLARILRQSGDSLEADRLCNALTQRVVAITDC